MTDCNRSLFGITNNNNNNNNMAPKNILYSDKYYDEAYEYRHVQVTPDVAKLIPRGKLMSEDEWRSIGIQQSHGWVHYMIHEPEPHILLFRRPVTLKGKPPSQEEQFRMEEELACPSQ